MTRTLPLVALQLWIVLFILFFGAEVIHLEPGLRVITQVLYGVPLAAWALLRLRGPADRFDWAVLGLLGVFAVVCLFSRDRTESLGSLALATAYAAWFLLMRRAEAWGLRQPIILAAATALAITLAFNAYLLIQEKLASYAAFGGARFEGVATFPWESVNALPVLVLVALPFLAWVERGWVRTILSLVVALSAVVVVPLSLGRAGWLGLAAAGVVGALLVPAVARMTRTQRAVLGTGLAMLGLLGVMLVGPRLITAIGDSGRLLLWEQGMGLIGRSPLVGSGPGVFSWVRLDAPPPEASMLAVRLVHSVPLQTLIDGGLLLTAAVLVATAVWALRVWQERAGWSAADRVAAACLVGFVAAQTLDDFSYLPAIIAMVLTTAAFLAPTRVPPSSSVGLPWITPGAIALAAIIALPGIVAVDLARQASQSARQAMVEGRSSDAAEAFAVATRWHPENGGYWLGLGMASAYAGDVERSVDAYHKATLVAPGDPRGYAALASLDPDADTVTLLGKALDRTRGDANDAVRLGLVLAVHGQHDEAVHAWGRAVALHPELLGTLPYGESGIAVEDVVDDAVEQIHRDRRPAAAADDVALWEIGLFLNELPDDAGVAWRAVDAARHGDLPTALSFVNAAIEAAPWLAQGYQAQAAVAAFACDAQAERLALDREKLTGDAYGPAPYEPQIRREFVYREAGLGPTQPPGARIELTIDRWPWSLIDRPECEP